MGYERVVIGPLTGLNQALDEIAGRALVAEPLPGRYSAKERVVAQFDKLTAYETSCILGALRNSVGRDLPLALVYELTVRGIVKRYEELADVRA